MVAKNSDFVCKAYSAICLALINSSSIILREILPPMLPARAFSVEISLVDHSVPTVQSSKPTIPQSLSLTKMGAAITDLTSLLISIPRSFSGKFSLKPKTVCPEKRECYHSGEFCENCRFWNRGLSRCALIPGAAHSYFWLKNVLSLILSSMFSKI